MSDSRLLITACPIPAEASTTTDSVVTARTAQRGFFRRTGGRGTAPDGRGRRRCGGGPPRPLGAGGLGERERGGVGKGDTSARAGRGIREHRRPIRSADRAAAPAARTAVPRSR
ncbi:hypothetical protein GCM10010129_56100 [Streptomyces fumigatiscleroticus]|nr:hypothetical protein GCM10010129_56100 [Streptomyces fumigatiscleroticus]